MFLNWSRSICGWTTLPINCRSTMFYNNSSFYNWKRWHYCNNNNWFDNKNSHKTKISPRLFISRRTAIFLETARAATRESNPMSVCNTKSAVHSPRKDHILHCISCVIQPMSRTDHWHCSLARWCAVAQEVSSNSLPWLTAFGSHLPSHSYEPHDG